MDTADLILLVNCRAPFYPPSRRPARAKIVVIDDVPQRPHMAYQVHHADRHLEGGVAATLRELARRARDEGVASDDRVAPRREAQRARHASDAAALEDAEARAAEADGIDPIRVAVALRELLAAADPIVVDETITHSRFVKRHLPRSTPDSYFYVQGGLGQGIAVAMGVKLAAPDRPVVLTVGDGSFMYNPIVQSLDASRAYGIPLLIVIFNNREYLSMKMNHLRFYPEGAAVETGEFLGVDLAGQPELARFAEPFGMHAETVGHAGELVPALDRAMKSVRGGTTAIVNISVSR
ncbi:thiamine pyrophosphate-dependent enzyme [Actinomadura sp. 3N407]|uniref:thiamine pyrophosphate-dependent enzyme n=1 Tax=Actinomadura sp. 3N407 TaxID=3457423 RepID=UPI003FCE2441